eukprot:5964600-Pleurochrysis_carterae.AAC.1
MLEQQLLKAGDEEKAQFVNGWNACESKFAGGGAKTLCCATESETAVTVVCGYARGAVTASIRTSSD